ncbi:putative threonine efflux protein [Paramagnetospirillum magnetotacticum MS-1]|uniref:Putative threonine efflux protein n=1 Tax=Paramagnetospirillum magnetotacticum MS-1 TaxID=272627 RepID=A0A0C2V3V5_PARME|nr:LysE family transporter [Paramagnetospirillum magnetotacticum]KIL99751.1 putative threonine efflux protein [Paramagnetospirillum magnetotacticum MS-1]
MDPVILYLRGIAIGFAIAAPIGPVGILCIRKALADGRLAAFVAGLGAALADSLFGAVAAFGIGAVMSFIDGQMVVLKMVGGVFMLGLGVHTWRSAALSVEAEPGRGPGMARDFLSTFAITITNPGTIFGVAGVFAALGPMGKPGIGLPTGLLVAGIFSGSALWWLTLSALASAARNRFTPERMRLFNHLSGAMLMVFGAAALGSLLL